VCVCAHSRWNDTGIRLVPGGSYAYAVEKGSTWDDWTIHASADGYESTWWLFKLVEPLRRAPRARWFALIGACDRQAATQFVIGTSKTLLAPGGGELTCFANDLPCMYWNNRGGLVLMVTRVS